MSLGKYYPRGDYDEGSQFSLNEAEWYSYLSTVDAEAGKFLRLFILIRYVSNHLDIIFSKMRWDKVFVGKKISSYDDIDVTTFHKNPINIAFFFAEKIWGMLLKSCDKVLSEDCWKFFTSMHLIHVEMISGVASMDTCEYLLALCHFKNAVLAHGQRVFRVHPAERALAYDLAVLGVEPGAVERALLIGRAGQVFYGCFLIHALHSPSCFLQV